MSYYLIRTVDWAWSFLLNGYTNYFWTIYEFLKIFFSFCRQLSQKRGFERGRNIQRGGRAFKIVDQK